MGMAMGQGQVLPTYTPFAAQAMGAAGKIFEANADKREKELASLAYMGDPEALQNLAKKNPQMALEIEDQAMQRQQREQQTQLYEQGMEEKRRKFATENYDLMQELYAQIGGIEDFDMAAKYAADQRAQLSEIMGAEVPLQDLTPDAHNAFKELRKVVTGKDWERSGGPVIENINGKPTYVQKFVNPKTQEVRSVPTSSERAITGWDTELRGQIKQTEKRETTREERLQDNINLGLDAVTGLPDLQRARDLLTQVSTGGIQSNLNAIRQYFGDDSKEVADMGELQTLLATDLIDKFSLMTGVLSESDMKLLQSMSAGTERSTATNIRLLDNLMRRTERKVLVALDDAREGGRPSEVARLEKAARELGLTEGEISAGAPAPDAAGTGQKQAPQAAIDYLAEHPDQAEAFKAKYGYLPEGF